MGLDVVELIMEVEEEFDIEILDSDWTRIKTVGHLHAAVVVAISKKESHKTSDVGSDSVVDAAFQESVWNRLTQILVTQLGLKPDKVFPAADFLNLTY